jgi:peptidoglycan hydrolase CwlO-like protein
MVRERLMITLLLTLVVTTVLPFSANARDIKNEQREAYEARKQYNSKKSNHENLLSRISKQEEHVKKQQEKLNQLRTEEVSARKDVEQSKANLEAKTKALNDVWDLRYQ